MKKAKILLACTAILAFIGGALAFRTIRLAPNVYILLAGNRTASLTIGQIIYTTTIPNCTLTDKVTTAVGPIVIVSSTTTNILSTTIFKSAGHPDQVSTFIYCTSWPTRVTIPD